MNIRMKAVTLTLVGESDGLNVMNEFPVPYIKVGALHFPVKTQTQSLAIKTNLVVSVFEFNQEKKEFFATRQVAAKFADYYLVLWIDAPEIVETEKAQVLQFCKKTKTLLACVANNGWMKGEDGRDVEIRDGMLFGTTCTDPNKITAAAEMMFHLASAVG